MYKSFVLAFCIIFVVRTSAFSFDHEYIDYGKTLKTYVQNGLVDYSGLKQNRQGIDSFVEQVTRVSEDEYKNWTREQQLAFWINVYNGWFLQIVIDHYPIKSTRIVGFLYPENSVQRIDGIWKDIHLTTAGRSVSLDSIEHNILRPLFQEPRIHFAIVCASIGCPSLKTEPYRAAILNAQLEDSARGFANNPQKVRLEKATKTIHISKIFKWFAEDFRTFAGNETWVQDYPQDQKGPLAFLSRYLTDTDAALLKHEKYRVEYLEYDWSLNDKKH
jgi:hypothetical protein